jgi:putative ABC transport system permease protein
MGFPDRLVLGLVLFESVTLSVLAGGLGIGLAWLISLGGDPTGGLLPIFMLMPEHIALGLGLAVLLGVIAGTMPAMAAMRLQISTALRRN